MPGWFDLIRSAAANRWQHLRGGTPAPEAERYHAISHNPSVPLPRGAQRDLAADNPRLVELRKRYAALDWPVCRHTFWAPEAVERDVRLPWFRGDNAYVWQYRQLGHDTVGKAAIVARHVESRDELRLLERLREDGLFGAWTFADDRHGRISRDLLDSVNEINFLERHLHLSRQPNLRVADIGAGYGRLAHRLCAALPNVAQYDCLDAVPESTFLCEYYLKFRGIERARSIPLDEVATVLPGSRYHLALNIHSFSECTLDGIRWWLQRLAGDRVPHLLIVPNHWDELNSAELDGTTRDFGPALLEAGYRLVHKEPVYDAAVGAATGVRDHFMLYELRP
ncbi:MAG TPA: hypothetical protein VM240_08025 [Verrucomicrobiae bacterium]|nr:hypothetical protein [Verrucomicrobiae bacterium]